jgi:hypothetical protein
MISIKFLWWLPSEVFGRDKIKIIFSVLCGCGTKSFLSLKTAFQDGENEKPNCKGFGHK